MNELADYAAVAVIGLTFTLATDMPVMISIAVWLLILRSSQRKSGEFYRKPMLRLLILSFVLLGILAHWPSFTRGISDGYDAARHRTEQPA